MSWKLLVSAGLLCFVVSPVFAAGPLASGTLLGLDTNGNWVWSVGVTPDTNLYAAQAGQGTGGSVAIETGITGNANLVSVGANATNFTANNPGAAIATFPAYPAGGGIGVIATTKDVASLGSTFFTTPGVEEAFRVHTVGPTSTSLTSTITLSGTYAAGCAGGASCGTTGTSFMLSQAGGTYSFASTPFTKSVRGGNANLTDHVDVGDLAILGSHYDTAHAHPGQHWQTADFTGDGFVDVGDLAVLGANYNQADANWTVAGSVSLGLSPGAGAGGGSAVPEPTSIVLLGLGGLFFAARGFRRGR